jgi:hypothetical protein
LVGVRRWRIVTDLVLTAEEIPKDPINPFGLWVVSGFGEDYSGVIVNEQ